MVEYWTIKNIKQEILEKIKTHGINFFCVRGSSDEIKNYRRYSILDVIGDQITLQEWNFKNNGWEEVEIAYTNVEAFNKHFSRI